MLQMPSVVTYGSINRAPCFGDLDDADNVDEDDDNDDDGGVGDGDDAMVMMMVMIMMRW